MFRDFAREKIVRYRDVPQGWQNPAKLTFRVTQQSKGKETVF